MSGLGRGQRERGNGNGTGRSYDRPYNILPISGPSTSAKLDRKSEDAVAEDWVRAGDGFGDIERGCPACDTMRGQRARDARGDGFVRERMRQRFPFGIGGERVVNAFVAFDERKNERRGGRSRGKRGSRVREV